MNFPLLDETTALEGALEALATTKKNFGMIPNVEKVMSIDVTWVMINEVKSGHWGAGGNTLGLDDVKKLMASD